MGHKQGKIVTNKGLSLVTKLSHPGHMTLK